ncbi:MAG: YadA C-terminal domain-containing protein [Rhodospirillaceae bacterium]|nr:YadA C-terminal domain-containing protein [Rhodospirillaceae bacterium]
MFLKRLIFTALGLAGMLGFGTAMGQGAGNSTDDGMGEGGIPAPKFYGDITACAGGMLPAASTAMGPASLLGMGGLLDMALMGDPTAADATIGTTGDSAERDALVVLLDPTTVLGGSANCANDVARGYTLATELYNEYTLTKALAESRTATDLDQENFTKARDAYNAYGGAVYDEVYNQRMRSDAASDAIDAYNALVGGSGELASLNTGADSDGSTDGRGYSEITVNDFVTVTDSANPTEEETRQLNRVYGSMGVRGFQAIAGTGAVLNADGEITRTDAFNTPGVLQTGEAASDTITTLGEIATELALWEAAVTTASNNVNAANEAGNVDTRALEETLRRATAGRDHVQSELTRLTAIVRSQNRDDGYEEGGDNRFSRGTGANAVTYTNERQVVDAYLAAQQRVNTAAANVRSTVTALDNANKALKRELGSADSYLNQLVTLRQYEQAVAEAELAEAGGANASQGFMDAVDEAKKAVTAAQNLLTTHENLTGDSPAGALLSALLESDADDEDDGLALVNAISSVDSKVNNLQEQLTDEDGNPIDLSDLGDSDAIMALTAVDDPATMEDETGPVTKNANDIASNDDEIMMLDGRVAVNEEDLDRAWMDLYGTERGVEAQHGDLAACEATGALNVANCANARSLQNEDDIAEIGTDIDDVNDKLAQKKEYIENLAEHIGVDAVTGEGGHSRIDMNQARSMANAVEIGMDDNGMSRIDHNEARSMKNASDIEAETTARMAADEELGGRIDAEATARMEADTMLGGRIDAEATARMEADTMLGGRIDAEATARADADMALGMRIDGEAAARMEADMMLAGGIDANTAAIGAEATARMDADMALGGRISSNADAIAANMNSIGQNASAISDNRNMIGELSDDLDVVRAGVAASMALAGMPAINGRGISIGVGSYDGESAFAVGFQIQGEQASFKVGVTSSGGETGASAGVGFNF